jgi:outer membrane protein assembly factor BamB
MDRKIRVAIPPDSHSRVRVFSALWLALFFTGAHGAARLEPIWPQFRGPSATGVSTNGGLPLTWSTNKNVAWSVPVPGTGWSSPIVAGNRVFLTSVVRDGEVETPRKGLYFGGERKAVPQERHHWIVSCRDIETGKVLWEKEVRSGTPSSGLHVKNTYAAETPVTDGERVYAYFGNHGLYCLDMDGKEVWSTQLGTFKTRYGWGTAASPVLHGGRLYVLNDNEEQSFLVALDAHTGSEVWREKRDEKSNWATPTAWTHDGRTEIVTPGQNRIRSYDLDGRVLWELRGMSSIVIPTPFAAFGMMYVCSGYVGDKLRPVYAIKPGATGDITPPEGQTEGAFVAWSDRTAGPYNTSPLIYGDHFYVLFDMGFLSCHDARTGKIVFEKQRINPSGATAFTASPWAYDGRLFCLSEDGDTYVFKAGPKFELIGKNSLNEMCMATPAIVGRNLLLRTESRLYRIRNGQESK